MRRSAVLVLAAALAACGSADDAPQPLANDDPALASALGPEIMVDPELAAQNRANAAASLPALDRSVPSLDVGPEAANRARDEALALIGGAGNLREAPAPRKVDARLPPEAALTAAARAAAAPHTGNCAAKAQYTAAWAARLPAAFPVYPRGAVQEAAGTDEAGCALRVVNFQTPVALDDVIDFYYTRASAAGFSAQHVLQDGDNVLGGTKDRAAFTVYARKLPSGATEVDLVTNG